MEKPDWAGPLGEAYRHAFEFLSGLPERPVGAAATLPELRATLGGPVPEGPSDPAAVVAALAAAAAPGLVATPSGRFFGFVVGGATPAALAADWLTSAWDQNACMAALAPAASVVEEVAGGWLAELLGLPAGVSVGFVTGGQMANLTGLAAARHELLRRVGWDVEVGGLAGAPPIRVLVGAEHHSTIGRALRFLGIGTAALVPVDVDDQGRMLPAALRDRLGGGPTIVCAEVGNVNTGSIDPVGEICDIAHETGAWVHVDGAFGLWAAASPRLRPLLDGVERADSWATDAHKWLNVPYDTGLAFCAHPTALRAAMGNRASYLMHGAADERDGFDYHPESSRRARGFPVYAAIRALGRSGIAELVDRCCTLARRFTDRLAGDDRVEVLNQVVLNQVLVRIRGASAGEVVARVQQEGTCWLSPTTWRGEQALRISVSNWSTDEADVDRSADAILRSTDEWVIPGRLA